MTYNISHEWYSKDTPVGPIDCLRIKVEFVTDWVNDCRTEQYEYEMLPDYVQDGNYDIGQGHEYPGSEDRRKRLSLASRNIWQVGWYLPPYKFGRPENYDLTNHILKNKKTDEYALLLANSTYPAPFEDIGLYFLEKFNLLTTYPNFKMPNKEPIKITDDL